MLKISMCKMILQNTFVELLPQLKEANELTNYLQPLFQGKILAVWQQKARNVLVQESFKPPSETFHDLPSSQLFNDAQK